MFEMSAPWWEFVVRGIAVYAFLIAALRLTGKRQVGQLAPFDLILLLILSNAVQNSMNAGDNSLIGGLISAATLVAINWLVSYVSYRIPAFEAAIDGIPLVLIRDGKTAEKTLEDERISQAELMTALRGSGCFKISDVKLAMLETNGRVSVWTKDDQQTASR
ncbi:MAG: DUF421 domain-containing protein [Hyphomicrobium sp.]|nr:DUF421 domain-containing protein [Hyphomicrobium sp.]